MDSVDVNIAMYPKNIDLRLVYFLSLNAFLYRLVVVPMWCSG